MSYGIAVRQLDAAGGAQLAGGQSFFKVSGQPVIVLGDPLAAHGEGLHATPVMHEGSGWLRLNGTPVCREGHRATCGHPSSGRPWFRIGD